MQSTLVHSARDVAVDHFFPYEHPLVALKPTEREPAVRVVELESVASCIENTKAFIQHGHTVNPLTTKIGEARLNARLNGLPVLKMRVLDLVTPGSNLYSHWLLDLTPKLKAVQDAGYDIRKDFDRIIVNFYGSRFKREVVELLGIDEAKIYDYTNHPKFFRAEKLVTVTPCRSGLYTPKWVADYVNSIFSAQVETGFSRKVYISRSKGNSRRILNEAALVERLSALGYQTLYCEDHSVAFTANVIRNATGIIAPHGAGLANIVFAKPGAKVIELFCAHLSAEFYKLALSRKLDYTPVQVAGPKGKMIGLANMDYRKERKYYHSMNMLLSEKLLCSL